MTFKEKPITRLYAFALAAVFALTLAGCGGGGGSSATPDPEPPPMPTPYEQAVAAIAAAETEEAARAAYDAVKEDVTAAQGEKLQAAVDDRIMAIRTAARVADQKEALSMAAGNIDTSDLSTQEAVDAANEAIRALRQALEDAEDVSDEDKEMYETQLDDAVAAVDGAQGGIDTATRRTNQMTALSDASTALQAALAALFGSTPTQAQLDDANSALMALNDAIADGADLTDAKKATYVREAANAAAPIQTAQAAFDKAMDAADRAADMAMAARAAKLYAGLPPSPLNSGGHGVGANAGDLLVRLDINGDGFNSGDPAADDGFGDQSEDAYLSEDKETTVAALHGWEGKRYTFSGTNVIVGASLPGTYEGTYEAMVWSNVEEPKEGEKFSTEYSAVFTGGTLDEATTEGTAGRVASPSFDHTAGLKRFKLPSPNPRGETKITVPGSYHGVPGTYSCTPGAGTCAASFAGPGFNLGGVTAAGAFDAANAAWTFKPSDANARVMSAEDTVYNSYGWWVRTAEDGKMTAHAFHIIKGTSADLRASPPTTLHGTATYRGGAAGQYALSSPTGGTNDAGAFTARATIEVDFSDRSGTGTIDAFKGADGEDRDWEVELKELGSILGSSLLASSSREKTTVWTIGDTAASVSGNWQGSFYDAGDDGVPKVLTGRFYTEYGNEGRMIGAYGADRQQE